MTWTLQGWLLSNCGKEFSQINHFQETQTFYGAGTTWIRGVGMTAKLYNLYNT